MTTQTNGGFRSWPAWLVAGVAVFGVLPFALLCLYAHPSADDWYMAADAAERGFWQANVDFYKGVTGRFFSTSVLYLNPMILSFPAFKIYCLALVLGVVGASWWAIKGWLPEATKAWCLAMAIMLSVIFIWGMASPSQGFYWGTGSACYTLPGLLALCVAGMYGRRCLEPGWSPGAVVLVTASLLSVALVGCSEVALAIYVAHVVTLNAVYFWWHRKFSRPLLVLLAATFVGVAIVALAPGNTQRRTWYTNDVNHVLVPALLMALKLGIRHIVIGLAFTPFFLFSLVAAASWPEALRPSRKRAWQIFAIGLCLMAGTVFGAFFVGTWSMGAAIPLRAVNVVFLFFVVDWVILLAGVMALVRSNQVEVPRLGVFLAVAAFFIFVAYMAGTKNNVKNAWRDLVSGAAARFDMESYQRHAMIRSSTEEDVHVPALQTRPASLFFNDLKPDPTNWRNDGCARFFGKRSVILKP